MALFWPRFQISSLNISNSKILIDNINNTSLLGRRWPLLGKKRTSLWSCCRKGKEEPQSCPPKTVFYENPCRRRLPQCPEHICSGEPSKCLEERYGKPTKLNRSWFSLKSSAPLRDKEKPSNCDPPSCKKELTFREYIFGPNRPLPNLRTCRMAWKLRQLCNPVDPRLDDPRYKTTEGDVLVYSEPENIVKRPNPGPQPKAPPPYIEPASVICKRIADYVAATVDCYCACVSGKNESSCKTNLCPVHSKPFRLPYEEMRPKNRRKKIFTCETGIKYEDISLPLRRESCTCIHTVFAEKTTFLPSHETCEFHEVLKQRGELIERNQLIIKDSNKKMSRCERLKLITNHKSSQRDFPLTIKKRSISCETRCGCK